MTLKTYQYVGPESIRTRTADQCLGKRITCRHDIRDWIQTTDQHIDPMGTVTTTFVVDEKGNLRIADRRSEHIACAGGDRVQSAGEMTFAVIDDDILVTYVTNQSTGYCPESESWPAVANALRVAGLNTPRAFHHAFEFRRCDSCNAINIVKNEIYECAVCNSTLASVWNF